MKIVAGGTQHQEGAGSNRAVSTVPMVLGLRDERVLAAYKVGPNVYLHACGVSVTIDSRNRVLHQKQGDPSPTNQLLLLLQASARVAIVVNTS